MPSELVLKAKHVTNLRLSSGDIGVATVERHLDEIALERHTQQAPTVKLRINQERIFIGTPGNSKKPAIQLPFSELNHFFAFRTHPGFLVLSTAENVLIFLKFKTIKSLDQMCDYIVAVKGPSSYTFFDVTMQPLQQQSSRTSAGRENAVTTGREMQEVPITEALERIDINLEDYHDSSELNNARQQPTNYFNGENHHQQLQSASLSEIEQVMQFDAESPIPGNHHQASQHDDEIVELTQWRGPQPAPRSNRSSQAPKVNKYRGVERLPREKLLPTGSPDNSQINGGLYGREEETQYRPTSLAVNGNGYNKRHHHQAHHHQHHRRSKAVTSPRSSEDVCYSKTIPHNRNWVEEEKRLSYNASTGKMEEDKNGEVYWYVAHEVASGGKRW